jgi:hypothetical protein
MAAIPFSTAKWTSPQDVWPYSGICTYRRLCIRLRKADRKKLNEIHRGGVQAVRALLRALTLLCPDGGRSAAEVQLTPKAVRKIGRSYEDGDLEQDRYEQPRPGTAAVLDERQEQMHHRHGLHESLLGRARWSVCLVAEEVVKRNLVEQVGRETIRLLPLDHDLDLRCKKCDA